MMNLFNFRNLYKLIMIIFLIVAILKIRNQLVTLNTYNTEIAALNSKIEILKNNSEEPNYDNSKEDIEDMARKDLRMYYPNETPYKGY